MCMSPTVCRWGRGDPREDIEEDKHARHWSWGKSRWDEEKSQKKQKESQENDPVRGGMKIEEKKGWLNSVPLGEDEEQ